MVDVVEPPVILEKHQTNLVAGPVRRISWGAVIAGALIALIIQLALNMLGFSIGVNTVNPATEVNPVEPGLGSAAVIWFAASGLIAFLCGGYVAGRLAGMPDTIDGILHGILAWALAGVVSVLLLTTSIGNVVNSATSAIAQGFNLAGQALADVSPEVADALNLQEVSLQTVLEEGRTLLQQTGQADLQPQNLETEGEAAADVIQDTASEIARQPDAAQRELDAAVTRLLMMGENITEEDRDAVVQVIVARTELSEAEARDTLNRWEQTFAEFRVNAEEAAREAGQSVADTLAAIAGAIFAAMVLGAFAGGAGGWIGSPEDVVTPAH